MENSRKEVADMNYIKRNLESVVNQVTKEYPVILVTGPRQAGKTTMLQKLMEGTDRGYVTDYYGAAEPPVRCGVSHLSGPTEPPDYYKLL